MASAAFEELVETFEFLDDWEDRYRHLIELGRAMPAMEDALKTPSTKVEGCASQVWILPRPEGGKFHFLGDSDAILVRGLIATLHALYDGLDQGQVATVDAKAEMARLGLAEHLSAQRANGLAAMIARIQQSA